MEPGGRPGGRNTPSCGRCDGRRFADVAKQINKAHFPMMSRRMMLGKIVSTVGGTRRPVEVKLFLLFTVTEPVIAHVKRFGAFHADGGAKNADGGGTVSFERSTSGWLGMAHFKQGCEERNGRLSVEKKGTGFGFGGGGSNTAECFAKDVDGTIGFGRWRWHGGTGEIGEEKMSSSAAAGVGENEICGIGAYR